MKSRIFQFGSWILLLSVISGCGFHLRGFFSLPTPLHTLYVVSDIPHSTFMQQLRQNLLNSGASLAAAPQQAPVTLEILQENFTQDLNTVSSNTQVHNYALNFTVRYQLLNRQGKLIYGPTTAQTYSHHVSSDTQLLGDQEVLSQQKQNMEQTVINQMFIQLNSERASQAFLKIP